MVITKIEKTKKGRFSLFVDGEFLFSIHRDTFLMKDIKKDMDFSIEALESLRLEDEYISAKEKALDSLSRCAQTSAKLSEKLSRYYGKETVEKVIARLTELGLIDDGEYAAALARDYYNLRGYSLTDIKNRLYQKKLPKWAIEQALVQFDSADDEDSLMRTIEKKYKNKLGTRDDNKKVVAALMRKGFRYDDIKHALQKFCEECEEMEEEWL